MSELDKAILLTGRLTSVVTSGRSSPESAPSPALFLFVSALQKASCKMWPRKVDCCYQKMVTDGGVDSNRPSAAWKTGNDRRNTFL